jgi:hypothetical protein
MCFVDDDYNELPLSKYLIYPGNINGKEIKLLGYRSSDNKKPSEGEGNVENYDSERNIILYKINTESGDSGSPIIVI